MYLRIVSTRNNVKHIDAPNPTNHKFILVCCNKKTTRPLVLATLIYSSEKADSTSPSNFRDVYGFFVEYRSCTFNYVPVKTGRGISSVVQKERLVRLFHGWKSRSKLLLSSSDVKSTVAPLF